jgi:hypothetical protein
VPSRASTHGSLRPSTVASALATGTNRFVGNGDAPRRLGAAGDDAAAREIKALTRDGCTEIVAERHGKAHDGEPVIVHLVFKRLC